MTDHSSVGSVPAEQRAMDRLPLHMSVMMIARGINGRSACRMKDICAGGALLELGAHDPAAREPRCGEVVLLRMFLGAGATAREHELRGRVAHVEPPRLGVAFASPDAATLASLLEAARGERGAHSGVMSPEHQALMGTLGQQVLAHCRDGLGSFFQVADKYLLEEARQAPNNEQERLLCEAATLLRRLREEVQARYLTELKQAFLRPDDGERRDDSARLSLVDKEQFEEWLVSKLLATRLTELCRDPLFGLQARLDEMGRTGGLGRQRNPFTPAALCEAFQRAIVLLRPALPVEKILYRAYEASVLGDLAGLYEALNDTLIRHQVLPTLDYARYIRRYEAAAARPPSPLATGPAQAGGGGAAFAPVSGHGGGHGHGGGGAAAEAAPTTAQQAGSGSAGGVRQGPVPVPSPDPAGQALPPPMSASEFLQRTGSTAHERYVSAQRDAQAAVNSLKQLFEMRQSRREGDDQQRIEAAGGTAEAATPVAYFGVSELRSAFPALKQAPDWREALQAEARAAGTELAGGVQAIMQMAEGLLQNLARNELMGEQAGAWFGKLGLPVLHSLLNDDDLLQQADHPTLQVLNRLAKLGARGQLLTPPQLAAVEQVVAHISKGFDQEPEVFTEALVVLDPLVSRQEQAYQRNLERVRERAEGEHRIEAARQRVQEALDERLAGKRVPQSILTLLDAGWRDLLFKTCLQEGEDSPRWQEYLGLVDTLLAIGEDVNCSFDLRQVLGMLKRGLQEVGEVGGQSQQQAIAELKVLMSGPQRLMSEDMKWVAVPVRKAGSGKADEERWLQKWMNRARRLQLGDWLELRHLGAETQRLRLAWHAADASRFVFVNHQGIKVSEFSLHELATLMHTDNALVFAGNDVPPVDDALEKVVHQMYEQMAWHASHDELTRLGNRTEFMRQLERVLDSAKRQRARHVLAYINIDQFKIVNSQAGLAAGDQLLRDVAQLLGRPMASGCTVARLHGDEFVLLLENCDPGKAVPLLDMRLSELAVMAFDVDGKSYRMTASAGLIDISYLSDTAEHLLRAAKEACSQAKQAGGNRLQVYQPNVEELSRRDNVMTWVAKLNQALEEESLTLRCQKIEAIEPGRRSTELPHYEVLLGMRDEGGEDLSPAEFVQAAERHNRMLAVDRWVVDSAFHWLREHPEKLEQLGMVSINLSGRSLTDAQMMSYILDRLLEYGLPPGKLCFEVTETTAISNLADAVDLMQELRKIGCRFALDDFGAGHSTYSYLKHLPLDFVKIDGAFVRELGRDDNDFMMVRSINDLAHFLGMQTIAEYVEDEATLARLREIGVDYAQGYGIEKPRWLDSL